MNDVHLVGDRAKTTLKEDIFGLEEIVEVLSEVVQSRVPQSGYILGLEGKWGSGKTTLLNFIEERIKGDKLGGYKTIRFEPWLVGTKEGLLREFFNALIDAFEHINIEFVLGHNFASIHQLRVQKLIKKLRHYAKYLEGLGRTVSAAAKLDPTFKLKIAGTFFESLGSIFGKAEDKLSLEAQKKAIEADLYALNDIVPKLRFVVLIDDTDRLDPHESLELLRLIKAVANFSFITYVVCFDRDILSAQIKTALLLDEDAEGRRYLEKIFQQIVPLPPQEPFALRRLIQDSLSKVFPAALAKSNPEDMEFTYRSDIILDKWLGHFIHTPRDAVMLCEAVKFGWPYLEGKADFLDYLWLQLIKMRCEPLYNWTKQYVTEIGGYRDAGRPSDKAGLREANNLRKIFEEIGPDAEVLRLKYILSGLGTFSISDENSEVFSFRDKGEIGRYERDRRLSSPSHWRLYFAFNMPSYAVGDIELSNLVQLFARNWKNAADKMRELYKAEHRIPGYKLTVLFERLFDGRKNLTKEQQFGLLWACSEIMDDVQKIAGADFSEVSNPWRLSLRLFDQTAGFEFPIIAASGKSLDWLAMVIRDQGFALGKVNPERTNSDVQWLTSDQFDKALKVLLRRFRNSGLDSIVQFPNPLPILFCWEQLGNKRQLRSLIKKYIEDDTKFLKLLFILTSEVLSSSAGLYSTLHPDIVCLFMEPKAAYSRLQNLAASKSLPNAEQARGLIKMWDKS